MDAAGLMGPAYGWLMGSALQVGADPRRAPAADLADGEVREV